MPVGVGSSAVEEDMDLALHVVRLVDAVKKTLRQIGDEMGLSLAQMEVLRQLEACGPTPMSRLAEYLHCEASNLTGLVDKLESRFLVERHPDPSDRRIRVLKLTDLGAKVTHEVWVALMQDCPLARLAPSDRNQFMNLIKKALVEEIPEIP
jgi:DNA-binding MarR family transcriptional regulator